MQISTVLGNGMVLQREVQNPVWGYTRPGEKVQLIIGEHHLETQSDKDGYFEILLPSMKAGGPWEIRLWDTTGRYVFQDVLFGDVFLFLVPHVLIFRILVLVVFHYWIYNTIQILFKKLKG